MKKLIIMVLMVLNVFAFGFSEKKDMKAVSNVHKVIYDLRTGNAKEIYPKFIFSLKSVAEYYTKKNEDYKIAVVIGGDAYRFFVDDLEFSPYDGDAEIKALRPKLGQKLRELSKVYGVKFMICDVGVAYRVIPIDSLYDFVEAEKTRSIYLIEFQNNGYAYIPVH